MKTDKPYGIEITYRNKPGKVVRKWFKSDSERQSAENLLWKNSDKIFTIETIGKTD